MIFNSSGGLAGAAVEAVADWLVVAISDLLGLVGERKSKAAVANGNGVR